LANSGFFNGLPK